LSIQYDSNGFPVFVPDDPVAVSAKANGPSLWRDYAKPTLDAIGGVASLPYRGAGILAGLGQEALGGTPRIKVAPDSGIFDDITGRSIQAPSLGQLAVEGAKLGTLAIAPEASDVIGERLDLRNASGLAGQSPEEIRAWQQSHPIAAYTKAIAEPVAELGVGMALDPTLGAMRLLSAAPRAAALLKVAESASLAGRTVEAAETAARASETLRSSKILQAIASGSSEVGSFLAAHPGLSQGAERTVGSAYVPGMAEGAITEAAQAAKDYKDQGLSPDTVKAGLGAASSAIFAGLGLKHAIAPEPVGAPVTNLSPERLSSALQGADLAQEIAQAREAAPVAPTGQERPLVAPVPEAPVAAPAPVIAPPEQPSGNFAYRVRDVGEQGIPVYPDSHAQATMDLNEPRAYGASRAGTLDRPQEIVRVDLDKAGIPYEQTPGPNGAPWIRFKEPVPEERLTPVPVDVPLDDKVSSQRASTLERATAPTLPTDVIAQRTGLPPERVEKGKEDVRKDQGREFSVEGQAVRREIALDPSLIPADIQGSGTPQRVLEGTAPATEEAVGRGGATPVAQAEIPQVVGGEPAPLPVEGGVVPGEVGTAPVNAVQPVVGEAAPSAQPEPIVAVNRREAYQALRQRYPDQAPSVKEMVDVHGIKPEWALDINKRWGNPAWETQPVASPEQTRPPASPEIVKDLAYQLGRRMPEGFDVATSDEGGAHLELSSGGLKARVNVVDGTIEANGGQALGEMRANPSLPTDAVLTIAKTAATPTTINHEMAEWMARLLPEQEQAQLASQYGGKGWQDRFARAYEKFKPGTGNALLQKIYDFSRPLADAVLSERQKSDAIMGLMKSGKIVQRMGGQVLTDPVSRSAVAAELESKPAATKKQVAMALANDLGISDIVRHEEGDAFLFDATALLRGTVRNIDRPSPLGVAFLRDVVDQKTNYGNYDASLTRARGYFGDDLAQKYQQWLNTRKLPAVGAAFERMRGGIEVGVATTSSTAEKAILADFDSVMPDLKQSLGVQRVGKKLGAGAFANVYDLGEGAEGKRIVARVSALPGNNARPRMQSDFIVPETGRYFTADGREVVIQPYTYSHEEVGHDAKRAKEVSADLAKKLEAEGFKNIDVSPPNVRYLDKEGKQPVVVDLGAVKPFDSEVPNSEWIANKLEQPEDASEYDRLLFNQSRTELPFVAMTDGKFGDYMGRLAYLFVDKYHYLRRAEAGIYKYRGKGEAVPTELSPASALELVPSRGSARIDEVVGGAISEVTDLAAKNGVDLDQVGQRLIAEHAPVRNRVGAQRGVENASGLTDAEAAEIKAKMVGDGTWDKTQPAADRFRQMLADQRKLYDEYSLTPSEQAKALDADPEWANTYVPLKHEDAANPWMPSSGGAGVRNPIKHFAGRSFEAENPIGYGFSQVAETIAKGEKNLAFKRLSEFVRDNPDPGWQVLDELPTHSVVVDRVREVDGVKQRVKQVVEQVDMGWARDHTIAYQDGGVTKYVQINDPRVMESLRKAGPDTTGQVLKYISKGMRFYSQLLTSKNPEFTLPNFQRDLQMALTSIGVENGGRTVKDVFKGVLPGMKSAWRVLRDDTATGEWEDAYKEYRKLGGPMRILEMKRGPEYLKKATSELNRLTNPKQYKELFFKTMKLIDDANGAVETGVRLSYFKTLRDAGMAPEAAVNASKNLTVNFDRRGALSPALNSLYLFFNASMQGGVRVAKVLNSPRGRMAGLAMMAAGVTIDQMNAATTEDSNGDGISDWDSVPEYVKERNILIGHATIPMPYGFNTLVNAGRLFSAWSRGQMSAGQAATNGALSAMSTFNPFGGSSDFTQMVTPSFLEPFVQLSMNKNFAGNAIVPEQPKWGPKKPNSERFWRTTSPVAQWLAQTGNSLTGGDKLTSGFVDVSPNTIEYWSNFALGGWSRILTGAEATVEGIATGEGVPVSKIPILRRQVYEEHPADVGRIWRATQEEMDQLKARFEMYAKDRQFDRLKTLPRPLLGMSDYMAEVQRATQEISKAQRAGQISDKDAQERIRQMQIKSLFNITKARERAKEMGYNPGYAAAPKSGV
jgi:hypothetical protein